MTETRAPYPTKTHRAFIALPAPPGIEQVLLGMTFTFVQALPKYLAPHFRKELGGYHITLRFLGNCSPQQLRPLMPAVVRRQYDDLPHGVVDRIIKHADAIMQNARSDRSRTAAATRKGETA